jgi:hypothetical protein
MTKEQAKKLMKLTPEIKAYADGKDVEFEHPVRGWVMGKNPDFNPDLNWRIAPEPPTKKLREWKPEEVPLDAWYATMNALRTMYRMQFTYIINDIRYFRFEGGDYNAFDLMNNWMHSLDQGKTWLPCGVEE